MGEDEERCEFNTSPIRVIRAIRGRSAAFAPRWVHPWMNFDHLLDGLLEGYPEIEGYSKK